MQGTQNNRLQWINEQLQNIGRSLQTIGSNLLTIGDILITKYAIPVTGLILTFGSIGATIYAAQIQVDATTSAPKDTKTTLDKPAPETLSSSSLLAKKLIDSKEENINDIQGKLIKADLFTTLRNLDGKGKGHLIRFLDEGGFIKANKQEVSDKQEISLSGANLVKIDLENAWLPDINLKGAYISQGNLKGTLLKRASLIGAHLNGADLTGADLAGADLTGADLAGADLAGADLTGANLIDAKYNHQTTTFPDGFNPAKEGMKEVSEIPNSRQAN